LPDSQYAIDQVFPLFDRITETVGLWNVSGAGKQMGEEVGCGHIVTPSMK
jgi:hypothetical protein